MLKAVFVEASETPFYYKKSFYLMSFEWFRISESKGILSCRI